MKRFWLMSTMLLMALSLTACQGQPGKNIMRQLHTEKLGVMKAENFESLNAAADNKIAGFLVKDSNKQYAVINGEKQKTYQEVALLLFSPAGKRSMYGARVGKKWCIVLDGRQGPLYDAVLGPDFSPDGKKAVYIGESNKKQHLLVNGVPGPGYDHIWPVQFSQNSATMIYLARKGHKKTVVINGRPGPWVDEVGPPVMSADGQTVAYRAEKNKKYMVVINHNPGKAYALLGNPVISADGTKVAYAVIIGELAEEAVVANNELGPKFMGAIEKDSLTFSPDGKRIAYILEEKHKQKVVVDGKPGKPFDRIVTGSITFSPDSKQVAYAGENDVKKMKTKKDVMVVSGEKESEPFVESQKLFFSPDSKNFYFLVKNLDDKNLLFKNWKKIKTSDAIVRPTFSPDGKKFAYVSGKAGKGLVVVINGRKHKVYDDIWPINFSPTGAYLYYVGTRDNKRRVIINGNEGEPYDDIINGNIKFIGENRISYAALKKNQDDQFDIVYVEETVKINK